MCNVWISGTAFIILGEYVVKLGVERLECPVETMTMPAKQVALIALILLGTAGTAVANAVCIANWAPVCGEDGNTYSNACRARAESEQGQTIYDAGTIFHFYTSSANSLKALYKDSQHQMYYSL